MSVLLSADAAGFTKAGYPTIATVGGTFIFVYTLYYAATKTGYGGWRNHSVWFFTNFLLWLFGLFLVFGPDQLIAVYNNPITDGNGNVVQYTQQTSLYGPRAAILGLQLMVQAAVGVFAIYSANAYAALTFAGIGIFNELGLIGSNYLFNYNQPIWLLDPAQCNLYFKNPLTNGNFISRCNDTGYLEFLRIIGTVEILVNGFLIVLALLAYATAVPAAFHPANQGAVPAGTAGTANPYGPPATSGAYVSQPAYANTAAPAGAQSTYTTTTAPTSTYATTTTTTQPTYTTTTAPTTTHL